MSDNKKYYYMRLKDNYFNSDTQIILESMQDGYLYSNLLLKLYLKCLKNNGKLMFNEVIPYNAHMLAKITNHQVGTVEKALKIFKELGLIEILDSGIIYMLDIQNFIGESSTEADRKRAYRYEIDIEKNRTNVLEMSDNYPPKIRDKEIDKKKELEKEKKKDKIDKIDKTNNQNKFINYLIEKDYIKLDNIDIDRFKNLFQELNKQFKQNQIIISLKYIIEYLKYSNEQINDKFNYLKAALEKELNKDRNIRPYE